MMKSTTKHFTLIELLVLTAQHCCHFISNACTVASQNTPQFSESERGGALVRMGTDKYGNVRRHAPQKTACFTQSPNTPLFFESERELGGKRKPSFLVKRKFSLSPKLSPFTLIELLVLCPLRRGSNVAPLPAFFVKLFFYRKKVCGRCRGRSR